MAISMKPGKKIITQITVFLLIVFDTIGISSQNGISLFRNLVSESSRIKTIDAEIVQYIKEPGQPSELFNGRYRADNKGRFRIDYHYPFRQIVININDLLYWYYPDKKLLYHFGDKSGFTQNAKLNPLTEFLKDFEKNFSVVYLGIHFYGIFTRAHHFLINNRKMDYNVNLWVEVKRKVVTAKVIRNKRGIELLKEIYTGYHSVDGIYFPSRIDVFARSKNGITRNSTRYNSIKLNRKLSGRIFKITFPPDVRNRYLNR